MRKPSKRQAPKPDTPADSHEDFVHRISAIAEARTLSRVRDYLNRGRLLGSFPILSLRAQWIDASLAILLREDRTRYQEFNDLRTEFDLRGLDTPADLVLPEATRLKERFAKDRGRRKPDEADLERANEEMDALCDRLLAQDRAAHMP